MSRCLAWALFLIAFSAVRGEAVESPGQVTEQPAHTGGKQVLLLDNEQALFGEVTQGDGWYSVRLEQGSIRVREQNVRMVCGSYAECYDRMRAAAHPDDIHEHLRLASWCARYGLDDLARAELAAAEAIDPRHAMVGILRRRLEANATASSKGDSEAAAERSLDWAEMERLVASVPTPAMEYYTSAIQPLLLNQCGSAGCHGSLQSETRFQLLKPPAGRNPTQRVTQRNLAATLKCINTARPDTSPLLTVPLAPHATCQTAIFTENQLEQYRRLVTWVYAVTAARQIAVQNTEAPRTLLGISPPGEVVPAAEAPQGQTVAASYTEPPWASPLATRDSSAEDAPVESPADKPVRLEFGRPQPKRGADIPQFVPKDPFDPEVFNRKFFGPTPANPASTFQVLDRQADPSAKPAGASRPIGSQPDSPGVQSVEEIPVAAEQAGK